MKTPRRTLDIGPHSCKVSPRLQGRTPAFATPIHATQSRRRIRISHPPPDLALLPSTSINSRNISPAPQKSVCISVRIPTAHPSDSLTPVRAYIRRPPRKTPSCALLPATPGICRFRSEPRQRKREVGSLEIREKARREEAERLAGRPIRRGVSLGPDFRTSPASPSGPDDQQAQKLLVSLQDYFLVLQKYPKTTSEFYKPLRILSPLFPRLTLSQHRLTGLPVVVKSVPKASLKDLRLRRKALREVANHSKVDHPHVVRLLETYESAEFINIVFEHCPKGNLLALLRSSGKFSERDAKRLFGQLASALKSCHSQGVAHNGLRLSTVLLTDSSNAKLSDFSASLLLAAEEKAYDRPQSLSYCPPEALLDQGFDAFLADIWTLGLILYAMLTGELPFLGATSQETMKSILKCDLSSPAGMSAGAFDLISSLLAPIPTRRLSLDAALSHYWVVADTDCEHMRTGSDPALSCSIRFDARALVALEEAGLDRKFVISALQNRETNNVTAAYELMKLMQTYRIAGTS